MEKEVICKHCKKPIQEVFYFCPECGKKLKEHPLGTSWFSQVKVYLASYFLAPAGLWMGIHYFKQRDERSKYIGFVAVWLTIMSMVISIYTWIAVIDKVNKLLSSQLSGYSTFLK